MSIHELTSLSIAELLTTHSAILSELEQRGVLRSKNNPTGDYGEWLVSNALGFKLAGNSAKGYDATDELGLKYQIKCRRVTPSNSSTQLSVIRNLECGDFDFLIAVIFDERWEVMRAAKIPHSSIQKIASYREHVNGHVMHLRPSVFAEAVVENIADKLGIANRSLISNGTTGSIGQPRD